MQVVLVNPPKWGQKLYTLRDEICFQDVTYIPFPIRLGQLAAQLRELPGVAVNAVDANALGWGWADVEARLPQGDLVVILSAAGLLEHDLKVAEIAKARSGGRAITAVVDNFVAPLFPERLLGDFPYLDIALRGQPEAVIPELARHFPMLDSVAGIAFRDGTAVRSTPQAPPLADLDRLPFMAYDLLPMERYTISYLAAPRYEVKIPGTMLRTTRDCPYQCAFCVIGSSPWRGYDHHWRGMSPQRVVDEMEYVANTYGHRGFFFWDETYTLDRERAWAISEEILRRRLRIIWRCLTRIDRVDRDLLRHMARSGCQMIEFGLESGDPQVRYYLNKRFSDDTAIQAVKWAKES